MDGIEVYVEATAHGKKKNEMHELTKPETIIALLDISRAERLQNDCEQWADKCKPHICKCQLQKWPQIRLHLSILWMGPISIAGSLARSFGPPLANPLAFCVFDFSVFCRCFECVCAYICIIFVFLSPSHIHEAHLHKITGAGVFCTHIRLNSVGWASAF